jgi:hypothetical protein
MTRHGKALSKGLSAAALALFLAGCGSVGSGFDPAAIFYGGSKPAPAPEPEDTDYECPAVEIREGGAAHRFGGDGLRAQAGIVDVARECRLDGATIRISVGVEGRVLLGTAGTPGSYPVPVRIVVKRGDKVIAVRNERVNVTIPKNESLANFVSVQKDIVVPRKGDELSITAGFDAGGGETPAERKRR